MADIVERLSQARDAYYHTGTSDLTDDEYDALKLHAEKSGIVISNLAPPPKGTDWTVIRHRRPMESMPACATTGEEMKTLAKKHGDLGYTSLKYDGLSIELQYTDTNLTAAVLRGDGLEGEDVLANVIHMACVPKKVPVAGEFSVYGELVVSWNNLKALNEYRTDDGKNPYKSPRNAVALVRSKKVPRHWLPLLRIRVFDVFPRPFNRQDECMGYVQQLNMHLAGTATHKFDPVDVERQTATEAWASLGEASGVRSNLQYQVDGLVFRTDSGDYIKLKFPAEAAITTVIDVVEQLGRTGVVSPVVHFEPVKLVGADIKRATGHNADLMATRLIGLGPGATVMISRRGDVIPHVEEVITPSKIPWSPSLVCPSCGAEVVQEGAIRRCSADPGSCSGTSAGLLIKFCKEMGIDGFGPGIVYALLSSKLVSNPPDLFLMDAQIVAEIEQPGGGRIGKSTATKLVNRVWEKQNVGWGELLGSVGIPGCGKSVMEDVAREYPDPESLRDATVEGLCTVNGIGAERARKILAYIDTRWDDVIGPLVQIVNLKRQAGTLEGSVFCITMGLHSCGRTEMEAKIRSAGGGVKGSVSGKVTHLICNQPNAGTSKLKRATQLGIPIISETDLLAMMGTEFEEPEVDEDAEF